MYIVGICAIPVVLLLNFLVGAVLIHQGINSLDFYGQADKAAEFFIPGYVRYGGSMITYLIVSGRSGSAFAAEIGSMKLSLEIDALRSMHIDPYATIVVPRILALVVFMPILVSFAIIAGIAGGAVMAKFIIGFSFLQYTSVVFETLSFKVYFCTLFKSLTFAIAIGLIGCYRGMSVHSHFQILGLMTTQAVVDCIFWTIVLDGIFSTYFSFLGI